MPPVVVTICSSQKTLIFRVSDQGGGFSKQILPPNDPSKIWSFSHQYQAHMQSSLDIPTDVQFAGKLNDPPSSISQLRIGLQLARVFTNYWSGEIKICTMYGYGSDVYVRINITGDGTERLTVTKEELAE